MFEEFSLPKLNVELQQYKIALLQYSRICQFCFVLKKYIKTVKQISKFSSCATVYKLCALIKKKNSIGGHTVEVAV